MKVIFNEKETQEIALKAIETILPDQKIISVKINYENAFEIETEPKEESPFVTDNPKPQNTPEANE